MDSCAARDACQAARFDDTQIWVNHDGRGAFLLTQPYVEIPTAMATYARTHGLHIHSYEWDGWYGHSTMPIRLSIPNDWPLWPIERDAVVVLHTQPVRWPDPEYCRNPGARSASRPGHPDSRASAERGFRDLAQRGG